MNRLKAAAAVALFAASVVSMGGCLRYTNNILDVTKTPNTEQTPLRAILSFIIRSLTLLPSERSRRNRQQPFSSL